MPIASDEHFRALCERFTSAAMGGSWSHALAGLSEAAGAPHAQLIGVGADAAVPFNWITDLEEAPILEWLDLDGPDPRRNARVRAGLTLPEMADATDQDFATEEDLRSPVYALYRRHGINHGCQVTLVRQPGCVVGMSIMQGDREGPVGREARRAFRRLAGHARSAISLQIALEEQAPMVVAGGFESIGAAAFVCDAEGIVRALTPAAEKLVSEAGFLALSRGRLRAVQTSDDLRLARAIALAGMAWPAMGADQEILVGPPGTRPLQLHVAPLPRREHAFRFNASTLVVARTPRREEVRTRLLQERFGLTVAEAEIALAVAQGEALADIALARRVSLHTLRTQLKAVFGKVGVSRQAELVARLGEV